MWCHHTAHVQVAAKPQPLQHTPDSSAQQVAGPRIYTNAAQPNGSQEYWTRMLAWGRTA
jgi:hypothetical protein